MATPAQQAETARSLLAKNGQQLSLSRKTSSTVDPVMGSVLGTFETLTITAVVLPATGGKSKVFDIQIPKKLRTMEMRILLIAANTPSNLGQVTTEDAVTFNGKGWRVESVKTLDPAGTPIMFTALVIKK